MVAIPNHHFFQWVNQLKDSGYEVYWFDVTDGGPKSAKIAWVNQIKGWKLKWDFPFRITIKKTFPKLYGFIQKYNEFKVSDAFQKTINDVQPNIVHCFEMQLSGLPILPVMKRNSLPLIYSSWGSDVFYFEALGVSKQDVKNFYNRVDNLITDNIRDYEILTKLGYNNHFLGVFPGNGGLQVETSNIHTVSERDIILIKGYEDGVGKASKVIEALTLVSEHLLNDKNIVIYSADNVLKYQVETTKELSKLSITIYSRYAFIQNETILELMGKSCLHIANSISDGMPNALLEAMAMGAFPIQSNPGGVTEEVITHLKNGLLIGNPLDVNEIANHIETALSNQTLRKEAQTHNIKFVEKHYKRSVLKPKIETLYQTIQTKNK